jgi:hypothetical protein
LIVLAGIWKRAIDTYRRLQPIIKSFWTVQVDYEKHIAQAKAQFEQDEKALKLEIEKNKSQLIAVEQRIVEAKVVENDLFFKVNNAKDTELLYSFISERSKSDIYSKHLGIISIIRRDFEMLNYLVTGHQSEVEKTDKVERLKQKFRESFARPLERIILYIDDLDRCPEENVVQVLEAVNLLMAYSLFIVVVGVDQQWVRNALIIKHRNQFADASQPLEPARYLEKIFQIPFYLKKAEDKSVKRMIDKLVSTIPDVGIKRKVQSDPELKKDDELVHDEGPVIPISVPVKEMDKVREEAATEALIISADEKTLMEEISIVVGSSPRAIKRFVNSYRIIKCHEDFIYSAVEDLKRIMFLLAMPIGDFKGISKQFEQFIQIPDDRTFDAFLREGSDTNGPCQEMFERLTNFLLGSSEFSFLIKETSRLFKPNFNFVCRFTFKSL